MGTALEERKVWNLVGECDCEDRLTASVATFAEEDAEQLDRDELVPWRGILIVEGEATGDGRLIENGALRWENGPWPLRWVREDVGQHANAVLVGRIDTIERQDNGDIIGEGVLDPHVKVDGDTPIRLMLEEMPLGVSADLDDVSFEIRIDRELWEEGIPEGEEPELDEEGREIVVGVDADEEMFVITEARVRGATFVDIPAFDRARLSLVDPSAAREILEDDDADEEELVAAVGEGSAMIALMPLDPEALAFEGSDDPSEFHVTLAFLGEADNAQNVDQALLENIANIAFENGTIKAQVAGVGTLGFEDPPATVLLLNGEGMHAAHALAAEGTASFAPSQHTPFIAHLTLGYGVDPDAARHLVGTEFELSEVALFADREQVIGVGVTSSPEEDELVASAVQVPTRPPLEWFANPKFRKPTRLQITDDGRVFGHIALWNSCHTGFAQCVRPPRSSFDYAYFLTGTTKTSDGTEVPTGRITLRTNHAGKPMTATEAQWHYENTGAAVADVFAGEDEHGVWVAGTLRPGVTEAQVRELLASPPSGDWRRVRGSLELIGVLAVNVPGFPIVASAHVEDGEVTSFIATWKEDDAEEVAEPDTELTASDSKVLRQLIDAERARRRERAKAARLRVVDAKMSRRRS